MTREVFARPATNYQGGRKKISVKNCNCFQDVGVQAIEEKNWLTIHLRKSFSFFLEGYTFVLQEGQPQFWPKPKNKIKNKLRLKFRKAGFKLLDEVKF